MSWPSLPPGSVVSVRSAVPMEIAGTSVSILTPLPLTFAHQIASKDPAGVVDSVTVPSSDTRGLPG